MADPFAFDKDAKDGDTVTLANGVEYIYEEAKDRWMVLSVGGSSIPSGKYLDRVPQFRSRFEMLDGVPQIPADADEGDLDNQVNWYERSFHLKGGIWWHGDDGYADEQTYSAKYATHLMMRKGVWKDASNGNEVTGSEFFPEEGKVGDIITVQSTNVQLRENHTYTGDSLSRGIYDRWRITKKLAVEGDPYNGWTCFAVEKIERDALYQGRKFESSEPGLQMVVAVSVDIQEPSAVGSSEGSELPKEKTMQLRGQFELTGDYSKAVIPDDAYDENGDILAGVWYLNPFHRSYNGSEITHIMVGSGYEVTVDIDGEEVSYTPYPVPRFVDGDYITLDIYQDAHVDDEYTNSLKHHVFRVVSVVPVQNAPGMPSMQCLRVSRAGRNGFFGGRLYPEVAYTPCIVTPGFIEDPAAIERIESLEDTVNGKEESFVETGGRLKAVGGRWDINNNVDANNKQAKFHLDGEDACVFNHDIIPNGRIDWANKLAPFPNTLLLKFEDGQEYWFSVEHTGNGGTNDRGKNFKIVDRGTLPEDVSVFTDLEFDIYERYEPATDGLQDQIDELKEQCGEKVVVGAFQCAHSDGNPPLLQAGQMVFSSPWGTLNPSEMMSLRISALDSKNEPIPDGHFETNKEFHLYRSEAGLPVKAATFAPYSVAVRTYGTGEEYIELGLDTNKTNVIEGLEEGVDYFLTENVRDNTEYASKEYVDAADQHLQVQIDELEQELDIVAPRLEGGTYEYQDTVGVMPGQMHVDSNTFTSPTDTLFFNKSAQDGTVHTWAALEPGDYIEVTDTLETRTAENYAMYLVDEAPFGDNPISIKVKLVKGQGAPTDGDLVDAKGFQLAGNDINDLDARYALKDHTHDDLEGGYIVTPLEFKNLSGSQYAGDDAIMSLSSGGSPTGGDAYGFDIPWAWFEKNHPEITGWVDDSGQAKWSGSDARLTVNRGGSRPGLTVKGDYGRRYADVTIPGFVIHVDKIEEPQWGHKFPEKEEG